LRSRSTNRAASIGRDALIAAKAEPLLRRLVSLTLEDPEPLLWGGEAILRDGKPIGDLTSAAYGHTIGTAIGLGYVKRADGAVDAAWLEAGRFEIDLAGTRLKAKASLRCAYDPSGARIKG